MSKRSVKVDNLAIMYMCYGCEFYYFAGKLVNRLEREYKEHLGLTIYDKTFHRVSGRFLCGVFFCSLPAGASPQELTQARLTFIVNQTRTYIATQVGKMIALGYMVEVRKVGIVPYYAVTPAFWGLFDRDWIAGLGQRVSNLEAFEGREKKKR